jgi:hypothetical protein
MGPTCSVILSAIPTDATYSAVDAYLSRIAREMMRDKKVRLWEGWIDGRPVIVAIKDENEESHPVVELSAGCNSPEDYEIMRRVSAELADLLGGLATDPIK